MIVFLFIDKPLAKLNDSFLIKIRSLPNWYFEQNVEGVLKHQFGLS